MLIQQKKAVLKYLQYIKVGEASKKAEWVFLLKQTQL